MLTNSLRYLFRFRKEFEGVTGASIKSIEELSRKLTQVESLLTTPEDATLFRQNILKVRPRYKKLAEFSDIKTTLANSVTNSLVLELYNSAVESEKAEISSKKEFTKISNLARQLLPEAGNYRGLMQNFADTKHVTDAVRRRFSLIEDMLGQMVFEGYAQFKKTSLQKNVFEMDTKKTKFKEDFQFKIGDIPAQNIELLADIFLAFGLYNAGNQKLYLMVELIFKKYYKTISKSSFGKYLFCLARSKKSIKAIEDDLFDIISQNTQEGVDSWYAIGSMSYLLINKIINFSSLENLANIFQNEKIIKEMNSQQEKELYCLNLSLKCQQNLALLDLKLPRQWQARVAKNMRIQSSQIGGEEQLFETFLQKNRYYYQISQDKFLKKRLYHMTGSNENLLFMDMGLVIFKNKQIGMMSLLKNYYKFNKINLKLVAAHQIVNRQTRRQAFSYFSSKVKGCKKDNTPKPLHFSL